MCTWAEACQGARLVTHTCKLCARLPDAVVNRGGSRQFIKHNGPYLEADLPAWVDQHGHCRSRQAGDIPLQQQHPSACLRCEHSLEVDKCSAVAAVCKVVSMLLTLKRK